MEYSLTIVTVCYNALDKLARTVDSVLAHKNRYPLNVEHLIVDGASTDGTPQRLEQWLAEGRIEAYVSEPDGGIYDAMNKGIRLARGKVLYFLNADDTLAGEDLSACVEPILRGDVQHCAAPVYMDVKESEVMQIPRFEFIYLQTPCCHQGYFASTAFYRELGGYDKESYRCIADADFMCRAYAKVGMPGIINTPVAVYPTTGFSQNCVFVYLPEYIRLIARFWPRIEARVKEEPHYSALVSRRLIGKAYTLSSWILQYGLEDSACETLLTHIRKQARLEKQLKLKFMLWWLDKCFIRSLVEKKRVSKCFLKIAKAFTLLSSLRKDNPYLRPGEYVSAPLLRAIFAAARRRILCRFKFAQSER